MSRTRTYTDEDLTKAILSSISMRQVVIKVGLNATKGGYGSVWSRVKELRLDTSHFLGAGWAKGKKFPGQKKRLLSELLVYGSSLTTSRLRKRLIEEGVLKNICGCGQGPIWNNKPLVLQLDHIDGDRKNNCIDNLRLICPNCHTQTETFAGRNNRGKRWADSSISRTPVLHAGEEGA